MTRVYAEPDSAAQWDLFSFLYSTCPRMRVSGCTKPPSWRLPEGAAIRREVDCRGLRVSSLFASDILILITLPLSPHLLCPDSLLRSRQPRPSIAEERRRTRRLCKYRSTDNQGVTQALLHRACKARGGQPGSGVCAKDERDGQSETLRARRIYADPTVLQLDGRAPASPTQRSGILAFQVHQLAELECRRTFTTRKRHEDLPSSYVAVVLNDEKVFQTRVKPLSAAPYINAASEKFCKDWTTARLDFAVMDYRDRGELVSSNLHVLANLFACRS